ncbi:hypothetical protein B2G51_02150 [Leptospira santarosai]|nr:hypothetical protein B2G51_02150 [Leptospira santarosai]OLY60351.1 hypothetical protein BV917_11300 [Leptospira santarosai serovar Guaricura]
MRRALSSYPTVCLSTQSLSACFDFQNPIKLQEFQDFETGFDTRTFESEIYGSNIKRNVKSRISINLTFENLYKNQKITILKQKFRAEIAAVLEAIVR